MVTTFACWFVDLDNIMALNDKYSRLSKPTKLVHINSEYFRDNWMNVRVVYSLDWHTMTSLTMNSKMVGIERRHLKKQLEGRCFSFSQKTTRNEDVYLLPDEEELLNLLTLLLAGLEGDLLQTASMELRLAPLARK